MRIHHLALRTRDLEGLERFYARLGLKRARVQPGYSVWLRAGDAMLMLELAEPAEPAPTPQSLQLLAFAVDDLAAVERTLAEQGVRIEDRTEHTLYFRDPDGRRVGVSDYSFD